MSKLNVNFDDLNELSKMFENMQNQANSFDCNIVIYVDNIKKNLNHFNKEFETNFSLNTTDEEYQEYFNDKYISFMQEHLIDNFNYKNHFNDVYVGYAHID